jgi:hypothetical protein
MGSFQAKVAVGCMRGRQIFFEKGLFLWAVRHRVSNSPPPQRSAGWDRLCRLATGTSDEQLDNHDPDRGGSGQLRLEAQT